MDDEWPPVTPLQLWLMSVTALAISASALFVLYKKMNNIIDNVALKAGDSIGDGELQRKFFNRNVNLREISPPYLSYIYYIENCSGGELLG
ncbi:MAG TPA: hypothetical protein VFV58_24950 [Blastocatellia bacterium]|jgi:hypothetical protein|nr:hypothetical protein [Blastocatellia bacterium]